MCAEEGSLGGLSAPLGGVRRGTLSKAWPRIGWNPMSAMLGRPSPWRLSPSTMRVWIMRGDPWPPLAPAPGDMERRGERGEDGEIPT